MRTATITHPTRWLVVAPWNPRLAEQFWRYYPKKISDETTFRWIR
jgi:hypothetical protein